MGFVFEVDIDIILKFKKGVQTIQGKHKQVDIFALQPTGVETGKSRIAWGV